jgi:hypothetical protein
MNRIALLGCSLLVLCGLPALADEYGVSEVGVGIGPTWAMAGDSPLEDESFKQDFDTGYSLNLYAVGPIGETIGWRAELGRESMSADADRAAGAIDGDYSILRWQLGVQFTPFDDSGRGRPYFFWTMGLAREDASINADNIDLDGVPDGDVTIDFDARNSFGMSFGGGYNFLVGDNWGAGADLHLNAGFFVGSTRWWWTPSVQAFYAW